MELGPSFQGLPLAASALLRGRTLTVTEIFSIFFVFLPVQKPQSKKLAFRILSLRSPQSTTGKLQIQKRERKQQQLRLRNLNCNETLRSSSFAAFFSRAARSDAGRDAGGDTGPASATAVPRLPELSAPAVATTGRILPKRQLRHSTKSFFNNEIK
jgi:hypothetical protein